MITVFTPSALLLVHNALIFQLYVFFKEKTTTLCYVYLWDENYVQRSVKLKLY